MKKRLLISAAMLGVSAFLALGVFLLLRDRSDVTEANCKRIEKGMTKAEVEAIFGELKPVLTWNGTDGLLAWHSADGAAVVQFDLDGNVIDAVWFENLFESPTDSVWSRIRHWVGGKVDGGVGPAD